ncbi:hypothetical protein TNCV_2044981 [Trichonephila clavipes]|nr:hypothetical protein TNCV_2044981 [Trichonephila clavipes]
MINWLEGQCQQLRPKHHQSSCCDPRLSENKCSGSGGVVKTGLKGTHFTLVEEVQAKTKILLKGFQRLVTELLPAMAAPNAEVCEC